MNDELYRNITARSGVELRPANEDGIRQLQALSFPLNAVAFYRTAEPTSCAEINEARLLPIHDVVEENTNYVPGAYIHPHGYVVVATTIFGDVYCFDLNHATSSATAPVVLLSHEMIGSDSTKDEVERLAKRVAPAFDRFLESFGAGTLDQVPNYEFRRE
jgi:hypothetical protein